MAYELGRVLLGVNCYSQRAEHDPAREAAAGQPLRELEKICIQRVHGPPWYSRFCEGGRKKSCFFALRGCPTRCLTDVQASRAGALKLQYHRVRVV